MGSCRRPRLVLTFVAAAVLGGCSSAQAPAVSLRPPNPVPANNLQDAYVTVVKRVAPSVVQIKTDQGLGSGIILDARGNIVTNAHVVAGATTMTVTVASGKERPATLVGSFRPDDLAVIRVDAQGLPAASFADSSKLEVGDIVMAIGNPLGLRSSVTAGIISAVGRSVSEESGVTLPDAIQTSADINPGNSGGALVDLGGNVVGIPTLAAADPQLGGGAAPGIGFAIPSNRVKDIAGQLVATGHVTNSHRAYLGVRVGIGFGGEVIIAQVDAGGPAAKAGLRRGDQITGINGTTIRTVSNLNEALGALKPDDRAVVEVTREDGSTDKISVTVGQLPGG
ncbi:MAG: S1C family serine protease [Candidatus Dormibacteria bacterium]